MAKYMGKFILRRPIDSDADFHFAYAIEDSAAELWPTNFAPGAPRRLAAA